MHRLIALLGVFLLAGCAAASAPAQPHTPAAARHHHAVAPMPTVPPLQLPPHARVIVLGDSWSIGVGADPGRGWVNDLSTELDWDETVVPGGSGTGFLDPGPVRAGTYLQRLKAYPSEQGVDLLLIQGGLNDASVPGGDTTALDDAAAAVIRLGRAKYPGAAVVLIGPLDPRGPSSTVSAVDARMAFVAASLGVADVSPTRAGWFDPGMVRRFNPDGDEHPNTAGYAYFAQRVRAELERKEAGGAS